MKRSAQFEKTMSHGVNAIHVINDIQPFTDDKLLLLVMRAMHFDCLEYSSDRSSHCTQLREINKRLCDA